MTVQPGDNITYTAQYTISQAAANTGSVNNTVVATLDTPGSVSQISDVSDDGIDDDGNTLNDPTVIITSTDATLEVTKSSSVVDNNSNGKNRSGRSDQLYDHYSKHRKC